jgi:hypothetical protein
VFSLAQAFVGFASELGQSRLQELRHVPIPALNL